MVVRMDRCVDGGLSGAGPRQPEPRPLVGLLLVDDEPKNLTALESVLAADDRRLVCARSGPEALKHLLQEDFAAVLLDVHMPDMDGFETAELIRGREHSRDTPIIFLTAAIKGDVYVARGYSLGAVDYIYKPFDPHVLRAKVAVFIDLFRKTAQIKRQASVLAETTAFLNSVLEGASGYAIMALDANGQVLTWNEGARRLYGYDDEEVIGQVSLQQLHADDGGAAQVAALLHAARSDGRATAELQGLGKRGGRFVAQLTIDQRPSADGQAGGFVAIAQDVTLLRQAERQRTRLIQERARRAEAERARDHLKQVLDVLPEGVLISSQRGQIVMANAAALAFGGPPPADDVWGRETFGRYRVDGSPYRVDELPLARASLQGEVVLGEQLLFKDSATGTAVPVLMNSAPLRDAEGVVVGAVAVFQDITAIKEFERQKDAFLAAASHDLRNPLAIVRARTQLLMRRLARSGPPPAAVLGEGLRGIDTATRRLAGMVDELLDVARLQMGRPVELEPRPTDLLVLARDVLAQVQPSSDRHQLRLECNRATLVGNWDAGRLERVLVNLLANAMKYSPEGGPVIVLVDQTVNAGAEWAVVKVQDRGIGIPPAELEQVFERFYRASNAARQAEGAGIGLAAVRQIVEQHAGRVTIESAEGRGTTVTVELPLQPAGRAG